MDFKELNDWVKSAPEIYHFIASGIVLAMFAHLITAYRAVKILKPKRVQWYFIISWCIVFTLFINKFASPGFSMLDLFLPVYFIYYFHSLLILQARFFRCFKDFKGFVGLFRFDTVD